MNILYVNNLEANNKEIARQLASANVLIAEQNKLAKERQEWALHTNEVIRSLNQQLAAALAACKLKDESLEAAHNGLRWWMDTFPLHVTEADNEEMLKLVKALTIQPDDSALRTWLGEPVAYRYCYQGQDVCLSLEPQDAQIPISYYWQEPLFAPKGMK